MKKQIQLIGYVSVLAIMFSACGQSYEDKAKDWLRSNVEHIVNINDNHQVLYHVEKRELIRADLATGERVPYMTFKGEEEYIFKYVTCAFPKDRGYVVGKGKAASTKFVVIGTTNRYQKVALLFDSETENVKMICTGDNVSHYGDFIINPVEKRVYVGFSGMSYGKTADYDFYNVEDGEKVECRSFQGNCGSNAIQLDMCIGKNGSVVGKYYYTKYGLKKPLGLTGEIDQDGNICLTTTWVGHGNTEVWKGTLKDDTLSGKYSLEKSSGRDVEYDFALTSF